MPKRSKSSASNGQTYHMDTVDESTIHVEGETQEEYEWTEQTRIHSAGGYSAFALGMRTCTTLATQ